MDDVHVDTLVWEVPAFVLYTMPRLASGRPRIDTRGLVHGRPGTCLMRTYRSELSALCQCKGKAVAKVSAFVLCTIVLAHQL